MNQNRPAGSSPSGVNMQPVSPAALPETSPPPASAASRTGGLRFEAFWGTDPGRTRGHNEDAISGTPPDYDKAAARGYLFIVADGMGGHNAGEVASNEAIQRVYGRFYADSNPDLYGSLERAMRMTNNELFLQAQADPAQHGMGTTTTAAVIQDNHLIVAHVGDSRLYLIRGGKIELVTHDHSWVEEQVRAGVLTRQQAESHPQRNVITRALATSPDVRVDREERDLQPGDVLVFCSDGLNSEVGDAHIAAHATRASSAAEAVQRLIQLANDNGGEDNISVGVIRVLEGTGGAGVTVAAAAPWGRRRLLALVAGVAALVLAIGGIALFGSRVFRPPETPAVALTATASATGGPTSTLSAGGASTAGTLAAEHTAAAAGALTLTPATRPLVSGAPTVTLEPTHTPPQPGNAPKALATPTAQAGGKPVSPTKQLKRPPLLLLDPQSGSGQSEPVVMLRWETAPGISLGRSEGFAVLLWAKGGPEDGGADLNLPALNDACNPREPHRETTYPAPMEGRSSNTYRWAVIIVDTSQPEHGGKCAVVSEMPAPFEFTYQASGHKPSEPTPTLAPP